MSGCTAELAGPREEVQGGCGGEGSARAYLLERDARRVLAASA